MVEAGGFPRPGGSAFWPAIPSAGGLPPVPSAPIFEARTMPSANSAGRVCYAGDGVFLSSGGVVSSAFIGRSEDWGETWALQPTPISLDWKSCASGNGVSVVMGGNNVITNQYIRSVDGGRSWTSLVLPSSRFWFVCEYYNGLFVVCGYGSIDVYMSPDGTQGSWVPRSVPIARNWRGVAYARGAWVLASDSSAVTQRATAGGSVFADAGTAATTVCTLTVWDDTILLVPSGATNVVYTTRDGGLTWQSKALPLTGLTYFGPEYGNGMFILPNTTTTQLTVSFDRGDTWVTSPNRMISTGFQNTRYGDRAGTCDMGGFPDNKPTFVTVGNNVATASRAIRA